MKLADSVMAGKASDGSIKTNGQESPDVIYEINHPSEKWNLIRQAHLVHSN